MEGEKKREAIKALCTIENFILVRGAVASGRGLQPPKAPSLSITLDISLLHLNLSKNTFFKPSRDKI